MNSQVLMWVGLGLFVGFCLGVMVTSVIMSERLYALENELYGH